MEADEHRLWGEYRATWNEFSVLLAALQSRGPDDPECPDHALREVESARAAHNSARDRLAAHLHARGTRT
jgi:hypothetical protein